MRSISLLFLTLAATLLLTTATLAQAPPADLFASPPVRAVAGKHGLAASRGRINPNPLNDGVANLQIHLPKGGEVVFQQDKFEQRGFQDADWIGSIPGSDDSQAVLTLRNGLVAGLLRIGPDVYEIRPEANGQHVIEKIDPGSFPECTGAHSLEGHEQQNNAVRDALNTVNLETATAAATVIDVMAVYTTTTKNAAGGAAQIQTTIQNAIANANTAFANSQVNISYNLVGMAEAAYTETGNLQTDLTWLQSNSGVASLRSSYGADLVSMFVENGGGTCGLGYLYNGSASYAHQVTVRSCAVGNLSYAHENGHNLGMDHDPAGGPSGYSTASSRGYCMSNGSRTVMATSCSASTRVAYFSNPSVSYGGVATGVANTNNNAATGNANAATVASFLAATTSSSSGAAPAAPSSLSAAAVSSSQINLTWADNANNESGFYIERSTDSVNFSQVGSASANVVSFSNTGLTAGVTYYYRVRAYVTGPTYSNYSNLAWATTMLGAPPNAPTNLTARAVSTTQVNLVWTDNATNETGFTLERSLDGANFTALTNTTVNIVNYNDTVTGGTTYYYRVRANNGGLSSAYSNVASVQPLASPWTTVDINAPGLTGSASQASGVYTISGAGLISGKADKFRFTYQPMSGDGEIKVRIGSLQNTGTAARVGVMIRETTAAGSKQAFMGVDGASNFFWVRRSSTNGSTTATSKIGSGVWLRLVRVGATFTAYKSTDGVTWTSVGSASITMTANVQVGFAVSSGSTTVLNTSVFNTVTVVP